jgi:AcrR family transcriptional regulator
MAVAGSTRSVVSGASTLDRVQRTELAKAARREEILDAARQVFAERGFRGTTIADIAEAAGIALGTIYLYFPSKEDVFAALNQRFQQVISDAGSQPSGVGDIAAVTRARVARIFEACAANRDLVRLVVLNTDPGSAAARRIRKADEDRSRPLAEGIAASMRAGLIRDGDAVIMTHLIIGLVSIAVYQAFVVADGTDADKYRDGCAEMIVSYLAPPSN